MIVLDIRWRGAFVFFNKSIAGSLSARMPILFETTRDRVSVFLFLSYGSFFMP